MLTRGIPLALGTLASGVLPQRFCRARGVRPARLVAAQEEAVRGSGRKPIRLRWPRVGAIGYRTSGAVGHRHRACGATPDGPVVACPSTRNVMDRLDRNIRFFGMDGQERLRRLRIAIVGVGGLGTHVAQQLAYLGVGEVILIDDEDLDETNKNRYVSAYFRDPVPGSRKVDLAERMVLLIDPHISIIKVYRPLCSEEAFREIVKADYVFSCVDNDGARLVLTELCAAYSLPYFDLATEILAGPPLLYGGRVCTAWKGDGCPICLDQLDLREAQKELETARARQDRVRLYGLTKEESGVTGPSVVSVNGVIASLAVTEFVAAATGLRAPNKLLTYRGDLGRVTVNTDKPRRDCYYCKEVYGLRGAANLERYLTCRPAQRTPVTRVAPRTKPLG